MNKFHARRSKIIAIVIAVLAVLWMLSGQFGSADDDSAPASTTALDNGHTSLDTVQTVEVQTIYAENRPRIITVNGRTEAFRTSRISSEISGQIDEILAENGAVLNQGDPIVSINVDDRAAAVRSAQNRVKQYEIEYTTAQNLLKRGFSTNVQVATKRAELESAKAALARARIDLENTKVRAPFNGILEQRTVEDGDYVQIGAQIGLFLDLNPMKVVGFVAEQRIDSVKIGQGARITLPNGNRYDGKVHFISRTADEATRTFRVEVTVDNPSLEIADGLTAEMQLQGDAHMAHRISPAVLTLGPNGEVGVKYVVNGIVEFMSINITTSDPQAIWVTGLPDPVDVIVTGQDFVNAGQSVEVKQREMDADAIMDAPAPDLADEQDVAPVEFQDDDLIMPDTAGDQNNTESGAAP